MHARPWIISVPARTDGPRCVAPAPAAGPCTWPRTPLPATPPTGQRWSRPPQPAGATGSPAAARVTEVAIEILPRAVQDLLGHPTGQGAIRHYPPHGGYHDQVYAYRRVCPTALVAVAAVREGGAYPDPDTAIDAADWHITTYRPHVGAPAESVLGM